MRWVSPNRLTDLLIERLPKSKLGRVEALEYLTDVATGSSKDPLRKGVFDVSERSGVFISSPKALKVSTVFGALPIRIEFEKSTLIVDSAIDAVLFPTLLCAKANIHTFCCCSSEEIWLRFGGEQALKITPSEAFIVLRSQRDSSIPAEAEKSTETLMINIQSLFLSAAGLRRTLFSDLHFKRAKFIAGSG
jgi:hypothetical protein